jgi:two-component system sensor histidine kinase KdpD
MYRLAPTEHAQADRIPAVLLAAVSHDLRTPLAAAKAAVSGLRSRDIQLTSAEHDELLATADESLDLLTHLVASLLDVSRLHAGALPVLSRPAGLKEIMARSLRGLGSQARAVMVSIPPDLSRHGRPGALGTSYRQRDRERAALFPLPIAAAADRVPPRRADRVARDRPRAGVPEADRDRMFTPFQRLGSTDTTTGLGLGLAVSRSLTEAMRGTLEPEQTPGGGLTMAISLPAAPGPAPAYLGEPASRELEEARPRARLAAARAMP